MDRILRHRRALKYLLWLAVLLMVALCATIYQSTKQLVHDRAAFVGSLKGLRGVRWEEESSASQKALVDGMPDVIFGRFAAPYTRHDPVSGHLIPWWRTAMGDKPYWLLVYYPTDETSADRARELFPGATIMVADDPWP